MVSAVQRAPEAPQQDGWTELLDQELSATQAQVRLREHQISLLTGELAEQIRQVQEARRQAAELRSSSWFRLGAYLHLVPQHDRLPLRHLADVMRARAARPVVRLASHRRHVVARAKTAALYCLSPLLLLINCLALAAVDLCFFLFGRKAPLRDSPPRLTAATVVIPTWNRKDLLRDFLPSVVTALAADPQHEIIVVDNASVDGTAAFLARHFPQVRVLPLAQNEGFGKACNIGVAAAKNEIVVLLNNDMRVEPDFLDSLLPHFSDPKLFAVASQIFFADRTKRREESGLTETWWEGARIRVTHHIDPAIKDVFPCGYPGGGSSAFDKRKFLELGGFDELFRPFYYEDTDLGRLAWKRGWKVLYSPASIVHHNHRGTIGRKFKAGFIDSVVRRNALLFCWKNTHDWRLLTAHFVAAAVNSLRSRRLGAEDVWCRPQDSYQTFRQLRALCASRWLSNRLKTVSDRESFRRPLGGYFRDRFLIQGAKPPERLNVLFVSPYPIEPTTHGGAVFMRQALAGLSSVADVHLISLVDDRRQLGAQERLRPVCKSVKFVVRPDIQLADQWTLKPNAIREFALRDLHWAIHRAIYRQAIDVIQLEYTVLGQYAEAFRNIPCFLFEHDVSLQSLSRQIRRIGWRADLLLEYLRMRVYEPRMLKRMDRIQVCSRENADYLRRLAPSLAGKIDTDLRAAISLEAYPYVRAKREAKSILFVGSFRHAPNVEALRWFGKHVFPLILKADPEARLYIAGSHPPERSDIWSGVPNMQLLGTIGDVRAALQSYSVFISPILTGSGVRVKLLEAFASGIPCVSTTLGAEGLTATSGDICEMADTPEAFAQAVIKLLHDSHYADALCQRARTLVERHWDSREKVHRLEQVYRQQIVKARRQIVPPGPPPVLQRSISRS